MQSRSALVALAAVAWVTCALACETRVDLGKNDGTGAGDRDATANGDGATCEGACNKLFACGAFPPTQRTECIASCNVGSTATLRECIVDTPCSQLIARCDADGFDDGDDDAGSDDTEAISDCRDACDTGQFHDCLTAAEHSDCRELCGTATSSARDSFNACMRGSAANCPATQDCFSVFAR